MYTLTAHAQYPEGRTYFTTAQPYDDVIPLSKLVVFTSHSSHTRRLGVASTIKNVSFLVSSHPTLLSSANVNIFPYILLPLMGPEDYSDEDTEGMPEEIQLLEPDKEREKDVEIIKTHLETLLLLTGTREGRDTLRKCKVYPIVRECHVHVDDEGVRETCDRLVQVIMRDEECEEGDGEKRAENKAVEIEEDEDEQIIDV